MIKRLAARVRVFSLAGVVCLCVAGGASPVQAQAQAQAQADEAFRKGLDARNDKNKNWPEVVAQMRRAIQANPKDDGHKVRTGGVRVLAERTTDYVPRFYLAEALSKTPATGCVEAVETWALLEQQNVLRGRDELARLVAQGYADCERAAGVLPPAKFEPLLARATQQYNEALAQASKVSALGQANLDAWRGDLRDQYERSSGEVNAARARLLAGQKTRIEGHLTTAMATADAAKRSLVTLETSLSVAIAAHQRFTGQLRDAEQAIGAAEDQDRAINPRKARLTPPLAGVYRDGRDVLGRARTRLAGARGGFDAAALGEVVTLARDASSRFTRVIDELGKLEKAAQGRQVADAVAAGQEAFAFVDGALGTLDRLAAQKPTSMSADKVAERDAIKQQVVAARRRFDTARKAENLAALAAATKATTEARDRLGALIATFGPVTLAERGVHQALVDGAQQFLAGEYDKALATLTPADGFAADLPLRPHVHMFRAAALYALFERSGERDGALRARAIAEIEQCKQVSGTVQPDPRAFGPRFIAFFHAAGARAASATPAGPARP